MMIVIQHPLADVRGFLEQEDYHLETPPWPLPESGEEFVRASGIIKDRNKGGLKSWAGEEAFCSAARAVRFLNLLGRKPVGNFGTALSLDCAFRRFYADGMAVSRVEIGLVVRINASGSYFTPFYEKDCLDLINGYLSVPIKIPHKTMTGKFAFSELGSCGKALASHYLRATTRHINGTLPPTSDWWLSPGKPLIIVEYSSEEIEQLPKYCEAFTSSLEFKNSLHYCRIERAGKKFGVWFLKTNPDNRDLIRRLRLNLLHLHAGRECLKKTLRLIIQKKIVVRERTLVSDCLQKYLSESITLLSRQKRQGVSQKEICFAAQEFDELVSPGQRTTLMEQLEKIRKNIRDQVERITTSATSATDRERRFYIIGSNNNVFAGTEQQIKGVTMSSYQINIGDNTSLVGDFIVADTIQNSFNKSIASEISLELKRGIQELSKVVADLCNKLPVDKARQAARDLKTLTEEATSEKPRRKWYELSAEGLVEAAKTVGECVKPVAKSVKGILTLLSLSTLV